MYSVQPLFFTQQSGLAHIDIGSLKSEKNIMNWIIPWANDNK